MEVMKAWKSWKPWELWNIGQPKKIKVMKVMKIMVPPGGQMWNYHNGKWCHLLAEHGSIASGATCWPNLELWQVASPGGWDWNYGQWHLVAKCGNMASGAPFWPNLGLWPVAPPVSRILNLPCRETRRLLPAEGYPVVRPGDCSPPKVILSWDQAIVPCWRLPCRETRR